jgi:hypothetical protein
VWHSKDISLFDNIKNKIGSIFGRKPETQPGLDSLDEQDLSRFSEQDIIL